MDIWGSFHCLTVMNNPSVYICVRLCGRMFSFPLSRYLGVELLSHSVTMFNTLWKCYTVFGNAFTILHSHQLCMRVPISPCPPPSVHLLLSVFLSFWPSEEP